MRPQTFRCPICHAKPELETVTNRHDVLQCPSCYCSFLVEDMIAFTRPGNTLVVVADPISGMRHTKLVPSAEAYKYERFKF